MIQYIQANAEIFLNNVFTAINTLICGLIVAFFTSTFLKKKEERTRIAGVIVEKRLNSEQEVLHYLEKALFKEEATIFLSREKYSEFYHELEDKIMIHKLWLDDEVKEHLVFMQLYFDIFNIIPLMIKRIPLPEGQELTNEEFNSIDKKVLILLGASFDGEINQLMSELDEKIIDSVYKLNLDRPKRSIMRDGMYNVDMNKLTKKLMKKTQIGLHQESIFGLIMDLVYQEKGIDMDSMSNEEYEDFLKKTMSESDFEDLKQEEEKFREAVEKAAKKSGVTVVRKEEASKYAGQYGISLSDLLAGKEPTKIE